MRRNKGSIYQHELIGMYMEVIEARDPTYVGVRGRIVDETKNTIVVRVGGREKRLIKKIMKFRVIEDETQRSFIVDGKKICFRPWDRIKKCDRIRDGSLWKREA